MLLSPSLVSSAVAFVIALLENLRLYVNEQLHEARQPAGLSFLVFDFA